MKVSRKIKVGKVAVGLNELVVWRKNRQQDKRGVGVEGFDRRAKRAGEWVCRETGGVWVDKSAAG